MAIFGREFIAVPDERKGQIVFKWPDHNIRKFTRAIIDADEMAVLINTGKVIGTMGPGRHQIDAQELPGLGALIDRATGGNAYEVELYIVGTRTYTGFTFGGRIDDVQDPQTGLVVTLRVFGDYAVVVKDPVALITNLTGTIDVTNNETIAGWVSEQLLKVMRSHVTTQIVRNGWPILGLSAYTSDIENEVISSGNQQLASYGMAITRMGNFDVNLSEHDEAQLKTLAKDTAYSRLAGSFNQYAAGEAALGAGEGMSKGGGAASGALFAAGMGFGGQAGQAAQGTPPPPSGFAGGGQGFAGPGGPPPAPQSGYGSQGGSQGGSEGGSQGGGGQGSTAGGTVTCPSCNGGNSATAKFCSSCGARLVPAPAVCPHCRAENKPGSKFCSSCGEALTAAGDASEGPAGKED